MRALTGALLLVLPALVAGCGDDDRTDGGTAATEERWGPLAVVSGPPSGDEALTSGLLSVTEECVTISDGDTERLLVWPDETTSWNAEQEMIEYSDGDSSVVLEDGDDVAVGGGGSSAEEDGATAADWIASVEGWVSEPHPSCPADERWFVGGLPESPSAGS